MTTKSAVSSILVLCAGAVACMSVARGDESMPTKESEDSFNRTTYCVKGGLPMEVQFVLPDNPPKARGERLDLAMIDSVVRRIDAKVAGLLSEAARSAWAQTAQSGQPEFSAPFLSRLEIELAGEVADRAPQSLGIEFCGSGSDVGSAALAAMTEYFSRSVQLEEFQQPEWAERLSNPSKAGSVIFVASALRLAGVEFDPALIATGLSTD